METRANSIELKVMSYLNKTAKHLFITNEGRFLKVISYKGDGKLMVNVITSDGKTIVENKINVDKIIEYYGPNSVNVLKYMLFHRYPNLRAIPNFKLMKERMYQVYKALSTGNDYKDHLLGVFPKE